MFTRSSFNAHIRPFTSRLITPLLPLLAGVLLTGLALGPAEVARAQADKPAEAEAALEAAASAPTNALGLISPVWRTHFGEQAARTLREGSPAAKEKILRDLIVVANLDQNGIDLSAAVPLLMDVFEESSSEKRRLMALHALGAIGTDHASEFVYRGAIERLSRKMGEEPPGRVRRVAATIVDRFYEEEGEPIR